MRRIPSFKQWIEIIIFTFGRVNFVWSEVQSGRRLQIGRVSGDIGRDWPRDGESSKRCGCFSGKMEPLRI